MFTQPLQRKFIHGLSYRGLVFLLLCCGLGGPLQAEEAASLGPSTHSVTFFENQPEDYDYGLQLDLPPTFGAAEFTLELWIRPDDSYDFGSTSGGENQLLVWSDADEIPYSSCCWWFEGNFLLDGHNNATFADGTFSLQFYGSGRVRWLFGDGASDVLAGGLWSVGAFPAAATSMIIDGQWHRIDLVRRWSGSQDADLELWIDGFLVAVETSPARTDMRTWWDAWDGFPSAQEGWFWGAEKQAAVGVLSQYEDYKGPVDSIRFFDRALTPEELAIGGCEIVDGKVAEFNLDEGVGTTTCDALDAGNCIDLINMKPGYWSSETSPGGCTLLFDDGFESGNTSAWSTN